MSPADQAAWTVLGHDLESAHSAGVTAASAGLRDAALGALRLTGPGVATLADAAVTSATPFVRAPLLARISAARLLHQPRAGSDLCPVCQVLVPCATVEVLR